ncbi:hypothetical protein [Nocardioides sp. B-3]|uniref:hypothetical protein n=1 Tax=Nocardioides sp. B-3 TaxID=2895565 RepID=UPI002152DFA9|nr:hypothetical protein [Nocardioides sp. B-3]UUZ60915.1 hypothetical protein LP418_09465 [Nocardioides sp. B-3]
MSTALRGGQRLDEPEMPGGQIVLQPPPELRENEGASGVLMNAIPMLGSLGSIVPVATMGGGGNRTRSFPGGRHVPLRHARLHHRADRPAA